MPRHTRPFSVLVALGVAFGVVHVAVRAADRGPLESARSVELRRGRHGEMIVSAFANGQRVSMMIDTGSTHTSVTEELAAILSLPLVAKAPVRTSVGEVMQPIARLSRLTLAGETSRDLLVSMVPATALGADAAAQGVIGQDVLSSSTYTFDLAAGRLLWQSGAVPSHRGVELALELEHGRFVTMVPQVTGALRLVPDSGAEALILYGSAGRLPHRRTTLDDVWVETVSGRQLARRVVVPRLQIGDTTLRNLHAALLPARCGSLSAVDGLLPLALFSRVTVDGPGRRLWLEH